MNDLTRRITLAVTAGVFVVVIGSMALVTLYRYGHWAGVDGPNTVGEAGKVYFAHRFAEGKSIFVSADQPPWYASMHGALLHATVGMIGRVRDLPAQSLYGVGRIISILGTLVALVIARRLLAALGAVHFGWFFLLVIAFFASEPMTQHAVSYRPDHWNLALSFVCCWLLVEFPGRRWRLWPLALIPAFAFFIKAPGLALAIPIALSLAAEKRWKQGILCAAGAVLFTLVGVGLVEWGSDGQFSAGMRSGLAMPISYRYALALVKDPQHWFAWIVPLVLINGTIPVRDETQRRRAVVISFCLAAFVASAIGALRGGSNTYYFVDSFLYGLIIAVAWGAYLIRSGGESYQTAAVLGLVHALLYVQVLIQYGPSSIPINDKTPMDISTRMTRMVGQDRVGMAEMINTEHFKCFSDDPGLNVLLDNPQTIDPLMQSMMIRQGSLPSDSMVGPVERQEYEVIVFSGLLWQHMDVASLPPEFIEAVKRYYVEVEQPSKYIVFRPRKQ